MLNEICSKKCGAFMFKDNICYHFTMKLTAISFFIFYTVSIFAVEGTYIRVSAVVETSKDNILYTEKLPKFYSKLIVDVKCELGGGTLILPPMAELIIEEKGYIDNGVIRGNNSVLTVTSQDPVIGLNILISGIWHNVEVYDSWFDFNNSPNFVSNRIIENVLSLTEDSHFCHIYFQADRIYFFELPYKGETNLGDQLPYSMVGKQKKENMKICIKINIILLEYLLFHQIPI